MVRSVMAIALASLAVGLARGALAEDLSYVSDEELAAELAARTDDLARTEQRIASTRLELDRTRGLEREARARFEEAERVAAVNAALLYRLSRHGAALRYLAGSASATGFLKRLHVLRLLVVSGLEARRAAGERLARAASSSADLERDMALAEVMREQLEATRNGLLAERDRRLSLSPAGVR